jgi:hypothetical protein
MANKKCKGCGQRRILEDFIDEGEKCNVCSPEVKSVKPIEPVKPMPKFNDKGLGKNKGN